MEDNRTSLTLATVCFFVICFCGYYCFRLVVYLTTPAVGTSLHPNPALVARNKRLDSLRRDIDVALSHHDLPKAQAVFSILISESKSQDDVMDYIGKLVRNGYEKDALGVYASQLALLSKPPTHRISDRRYWTYYQYAKLADKLKDEKTARKMYAMTLNLVWGQGVLKPALVGPKPAHPEEIRDILLLYRGDELRRIGDSVQPIVMFRDIERRRPRWAVVHYELAAVLREKGRAKEADAQFRLARKVDTTGVSANLTRYLLPDK